VQYAETVQERGTAVDVTLSGNDLKAQAAMLHNKQFSDTQSDGLAYLVPSVSFTPWYDLLELLSNDDDNVVGRITPVTRSQGTEAAAVTPPACRSSHYQILLSVQIIIW